MDQEAVALWSRPLLNHRLEKPACVSAVLAVQLIYRLVYLQVGSFKLGLLHVEDY